MDKETLTEKRFASLEEELSYLREKVRSHELQAVEGEGSPQGAARSAIREYREAKPESVLEPGFQMRTEEVSRIALDLSPESHANQMGELAAVLVKKGVKNALLVASHLKNPHLDDDFERFLVEYIKEGFPVSGVGSKSELFRALQMTLYEITLPERGKEERQKTLKELVSGMEQFYSGMLSVKGEKAAGPDYFTLEIAVANHSDEFIFYAAVPDSRRDLFEKQILSIFHDAKISVKKDDYNIFNESGATASSYASLSKNPIFPLKTYEQFDHDPLAVLLNSFSKIDRDGEGAAIQIIVYPTSERYGEKYKYALDRVEKGVKLREAIDIPEKASEHVWKFAKEAAKEFFGSAEKKKKEEEKKIKEPPKADAVAVEQIKNKIGSPITKVSMRLVASSRSEAEAAEILSDLESSFNQFENSNGNKLQFVRQKGSRLAELLHNFSFRLYEENEAMPLSIRELTTLLHFPSTGTPVAPQVKVAKARSAPAPVGLPAEGTLLGVNRDRNQETKVYLTRDDRMRHFYTVGQTGTGKTTLLKNMIAQDIKNGHGVCMIDPHGTDIQDVLAAIPPERFEDVIYFDPGYTPRPMALNMLEYDQNFPEQKTFVVNELFSIFQKLYGAIPESMGPMFEQYFRNATLLVIEDPSSGSTLFEVSRVLANKAFRDLKLSRCRNPVVVEFWREVAEKAGGEAALANIVPYITSKFDVFLANDIMRPIVAQEKSSWNFREIMDGRKIMLVNLSKGRLGEINSHLIGLIIVGKILMSALSRVDTLGGSLGKDLPPFYLYIDEFQNITTPSIATILSEARKYRLSLNIAHQFVKQLDEKIKDAVFGNVGSIASFRVGAEDGEFLEKQFAPVFTTSDLINLEHRHAYVRLLSGGRPTKPFSLETLPPPHGNLDQVDKLKELSYLKFGRERAVVEAEVMGRYKKIEKREAGNTDSPPSTY